VTDYSNDPAALRSLFQRDRVHRDVYLDPVLFRLEQERLFARAWIFLGHASQVPNAGDFVTVDLSGRSFILVRLADRSLRVLANRCAHKGAAVLSERAGNTGRALRCPYHGWSYRLDGTLLGVPMRDGYEGTAMRECEAGKGLHRVAMAEHRGFVFIRMSGDGEAFADYFGPALAYIDNMADRSPVGELEVAGPPLRNVIRCNWKAYLENINDALHVHAAHEPSANAARTAWAGKPADAPRPMAIEQMAPFQSSMEFMDSMGGRVFGCGHSIMGIHVSTHSGYSDVPGYQALMEEAYGAERAQAILRLSPQNVVLYPSIAIKGSLQTMRVLRPLAPDRTLIESWAFRPKGAPELLTERSMSYNRITFSPMSLLAQDDIHVFEAVHRGLAAPGNEWVSLHRGYREDEADAAERETTALNELMIRHQYRAWMHFMAPGSNA
jgi:phenylpropionate dioxygenase-like ring-hydroxylating dioxygenase large terminal subunit